MQTTNILHILLEHYEFIISQLWSTANYTIFAPWVSNYYANLRSPIILYFMMVLIFVKIKLCDQKGRRF